MMYVFQVKPGSDPEVAAALRKRGYFVRCPQRTMSIRKDGEWTERTEPVFAGYLFLEHPYKQPLNHVQYYDICKTDGVVGFLKDGTEPAQLAEHRQRYHQIYSAVCKIPVLQRTCICYQRKKMVSAHEVGARSGSP